MRRNYINIAHSMVHMVSTTVGFEIARLIKCSFILGTQTVLFSGASIVAPLFGSSKKNLYKFTLFIAIKALVSSFLLAASTSLLLISHIPLVFAALAFAIRSRLAITAFFILSITAFVMNPIGGAAWLYPLMWLIPIIGVWISQESITVKALQSTFAAHAVGSLLYLYLIPMSAPLWLALIPIALAERLLFTVGIVGVHSALKTLRPYLSTVRFVHLFNVG